MVNPIDKEEFAAFCQIADKTMPFHTPNAFKIPHTFGPYPRKNLMEYSAEKMNKFINNNQHTIEEMSHRGSSLADTFRDYANHYYKIYGILNHDVFYKARHRDGYRVNLKPDFSEIRELGTMGNTRGYFNEFPGITPGADIEGGGTGAHNTGLDGIRGCKAPNTAVIGQYYNRIAVNVFGIGSGSNIRLACYDDNTNPNNLLGQTASFAGATGFNWQPFTAEFAVTTTQLWFEAQFETYTQANIYYNVTANTNVSKGQAFGAFPNPFGSPSADDKGINIKIGYN